MATSKPSGKAAIARMKKAPNGATDGKLPRSDLLAIASDEARGAALDGTTSKRAFGDGELHVGPGDGVARDGLASDGVARDGLASDGVARDGLTSDVALQDGSMSRRAVVDGAKGPSDSQPSARKPLKISTVSHTLDAAVADRLRHFAFRERISESAVIEFALRELFSSAPEDVELGRRLRKAGAALRRKA